MKASPLVGALFAIAFSFLSMSSSTFAATASNVKCDKCVDTNDIAKKAITASRIKSDAVTASKIKDGAVTIDKLSDDVLDFLQSASSAKNYVVVDFNNQIVGEPIGGGEGAMEPLIMSPQGYFAVVHVGTGKVSGSLEPFFTGANCTGTAYVSLDNYYQELLTDEGEYVNFSRSLIGAVSNIWNGYRTGGQLEYWYIPKIPTSVANIMVQSLKVYVSDWIETSPGVYTETETVECYAVTDMILSRAVEAFPNDPAITGFQNTAFPDPLRYDYR